MPTIEIICLEQEMPFQFPDSPFAVRAEKELISHRGLFADDFQQMRGCIYHLGNPEMREKESGGFFAGQLLDWHVEADILKFEPEFASAVQTLLEKLLAASPLQKVIFSSDYQFGGKARRYKRPLTLTNFWEKHDAKKLRLNALYFLWEKGK